MGDCYSKHKRRQEEQIELERRQSQARAELHRAIEIGAKRAFELVRNATSTTNKS
jgi:hypothetical protein